MTRNISLICGLSLQNNDCSLCTMSFKTRCYLARRSWQWPASNSVKASNTNVWNTHTAAVGSQWEQGSHLGNACYMSLQRGCWTDYIHCLLLIWRGPVSIPSDTSRLQWICMKIMKDAGCEDLFTMTTEPEPVSGRDKCNRRTDAATHNLKVNITSH
jgi:hypothetical protein